MSSKKPNGVRDQQYSTDYLSVAWNWFTYLSGKSPLNEVTIVDREQKVEARA